MMKINEELTELLPTDITHIMKTNEQSLIQAKPILKLLHAEVTWLTIDIGKMCDRGCITHLSTSTRYLDMADGSTNVDIANGTNDNS